MDEPKQQATNSADPQSIDLPRDPITPGTKTPKYRKILCIEDEHFISDLYSRALQKAGYEVTVIVNGEEGMKAAQTNQYDIVLLDIMVPGITGTEILKRLRSEDQKPQLKAKIIIATNLEQSETIREEIEKHADGYLIKAEVTPKQMVQFLQSLE